jgi:hypothetical protein
MHCLLQFYILFGKCNLFSVQCDLFSVQLAVVGTIYNQYTITPLLNLGVPLHKCTN